jgi:hypothetical protein
VQALASETPRAPATSDATAGPLTVPAPSPTNTLGPIQANNPGSPAVSSPQGSFFNTTSPAYGTSPSPNTSKGVSLIPVPKKSRVGMFLIMGAMAGVVLLLALAVVALLVMRQRRKAAGTAPPPDKTAVRCCYHCNHHDVRQMLHVTPWISHFSFAGARSTLCLNFHPLFLVLVPAAKSQARCASCGRL